MTPQEVVRAAKAELGELDRMIARWEEACFDMGIELAGKPFTSWKADMVGDLRSARTSLEDFIVQARVEEADADRSQG